MRIIVFGATGSGQRTLAGELARRLGVPLFDGTIPAEENAARILGIRFTQ